MGNTPPSAPIETVSIADDLWTLHADKNHFMGLKEIYNNALIIKTPEKKLVVVTQCHISFTHLICAC